ncbi:MAG: AraC family transcriptional regulator [Turicibacter sp.]|nr:AraC family transcriptional regulator [Turicibacter sp.]
MFLKEDQTTYNTYGLRFQEPTMLDQIATIRAIGCEHRKAEDNYYWDCRTRIDTETFIFQYTFSGCGELEINGTVYSLPENHAFIVAVPEDCHYYIPPSSEEWNFIFITLAGIEAQKCWEYINSQHGYVFEIPIESALIQRLITTYIRVVEGKITDAYRTSNKAYELLTYCYRHFENRSTPEITETPQAIKKAIDFIKENCAAVLNIEDIAEHVGLSKSYLNKKFKAYTSLSPISYLNKYRIEKSLYLLEHTQKTVKEIALEIGFSNPNYFCKVFRKATGISPGMFQKNKGLQDRFDFLVTEYYGTIELD